MYTEQANQRGIQIQKKKTISQPTISDAIIKILALKKFAIYKQNLQ
jgi:hypothetical protein